jgi:hypothetical protein
MAGDGSEGCLLTHAGVVVYHAENSIASFLVMIIRTYAAEHGRPTQIGPRLVTQISVRCESFHFERDKTYRVEGYLMPVAARSTRGG